MYSVNVLFDFVISGFHIKTTWNNYKEHLFCVEQSLRSIRVAVALKGRTNRDPWQQSQCSSSLLWPSPLHEAPREGGLEEGQQVY